MTDWSRELLAILDERGIKGKVERTRNHPRLVFMLDGRERKFVFAGSPSYRHGRGLQNAIAELRKVIGAKRVKNRANRRRRNSCKREVLSLPKITIRPDPFEKLEALKQAMAGSDG